MIGKPPPTCHLCKPLNRVSASEADHVKLRRDAYVAFLDIRQLYEREIQAALDELGRLGGTHEDARSMAQDDLERLVNQRVRELQAAKPVRPDRDAPHSR
ncbi:MAG: hypothetical protein V4647_14830 [Pseudomonadota bacterium]